MNVSHGTVARYRTGCGCVPCRAASAAYRKTIREQPPQLVDPGPARQHIAQLAAMGVGWKRVAALARLTPSTVSSVLYDRPTRPRSARISRYTAAAILSVTPQRVLCEASPRARVDGTGTRRRMQALVALGWPVSELATRMERAKPNVTAIVNDAGPVTASTARAVAALYDELWATTPPQETPQERGAARKARDRAGRNGWVPPMAWSDDEIDDPNATPDMGEPESYPNRRIDPDEVEWLRSFGTSDELIAHQLGVKPHAIYTAMRQAS